MFGDDNKPVESSTGGASDGAAGGSGGGGDSGAVSAAGSLAGSPLMGGSRRKSSFEGSKPSPVRWKCPVYVNFDFHGCSVPRPFMSAVVR